MAFIVFLVVVALASAHNNWSVIKWSVENPVTHAMQGLFHKVVLPMFVSPVCGTIVGFAFMGGLSFLIRSWRPARVNAFFSKGRIVWAWVLTIPVTGTLGFLLYKTVGPLR